MPAARPLARHLPPIFAMLLLTACGGGGGGGGDDEPDPFLSASYDFEVTNPAGAPPPLTNVGIQDGNPVDQYSVDAGTGSFRGRYTVDSEDVGVFTTTTYTVDWTLGGPVPTLSTVAVTQQPTWELTRQTPSNGALAITWNNQVITVTYDLDTVDVALDGGVPVSWPIASFLTLDQPDSASPDWQQVAGRASRAMSLMVSQVRSNATFMGMLVDGALDSGPDIVTCESIPGTPPLGIRQTGEVVTSELNPADFRVTQDDCFVPTSQANIGFLLTGTTDRENLQFTVESGGLVSQAGFTGSAQTPGGVELDTRRRIINETAGAWDFTDSEATLSGGYSILFDDALN